MTVGGVTQDVSLLKSLPSVGIDWEYLKFPGGLYRVCYDMDRRTLPFTLSLKKFTPGKDPGSGSFATYQSEVGLTDPEEGLKDDPRKIFMNSPLTHKGWTFYQSRFGRATDPDTGQRDGLYASFFQVRYDPAWQVVYIGCLLVVLGTFVQFYMRAGVFTDGGKKEKAAAEARQAKKTAKGGASLAPTTPTEAPDHDEL